MERRKYPRFRTQDICYAVLSGNYAKIGKICDISKDGLAFRYLYMDTAAVVFSHVDIFLVTNRFYLYSVPCKMIYETEDKLFGNGFLPQRFRCGLQFWEPTMGQSEQLDLFMQNYATGMVGEMDERRERTDDRGQMTDDKGQMTEDRGQRPFSLPNSTFFLKK